MKYDPICLIHGKRHSEHDCLYCCLCFRPLTPEECHVLPDGQKEDVCNECARREEEYGRWLILNLLRKKSKINA